LVKRDSDGEEKIRQYQNARDEQSLETKRHDRRRRRGFAVPFGAVVDFEFIHVATCGRNERTDENNSLGRSAKRYKLSQNKQYISNAPKTTISMHVSKRIS